MIIFYIAAVEAPAKFSHNGGITKGDHAMPPRLVRSKRGRVAHRPGCRKFRSRITDAVADCADARSALCTQCAPMCVVCFSEPGRPTGCVEDHGICYDCLELHLGQHAQNDPAAPLRCPCGSGELDFLNDVPPEAFARWRDAIGTRRCTVPQPSIAARMCEEARTLACPHCGRQFVDFDGLRRPAMHVRQILLCDVPRSVRRGLRLGARACGPVSSQSGRALLRIPGTLPRGLASNGPRESMRVLAHGIGHRWHCARAGVAPRRLRARS